VLVNYYLNRRQDIDSPLVLEACDREYDPTELFPSEAWIVPIFEPIRR
jgi:hypothetical protein